jgi:hypothetical protein
MRVIDQGGKPLIIELRDGDRHALTPLSAAD